jgi:hypothetical protein
LNSKLYHPSNSIFKMADKILHGPKKDSYAEITSLGEFFFNQAERYGNNICQVPIFTNIN